MISEIDTILFSWGIKVGVWEIDVIKYVDGCMFIK